MRIEKHVELVSKPSDTFSVQIVIPVFIKRGDDENLRSICRMQDPGDIVRSNQRKDGSYLFSAV